MMTTTASMRAGSASAAGNASKCLKMSYFVSFLSQTRSLTSQTVARQNARKYGQYGQKRPPMTENETFPRAKLRQARNLTGDKAIR